MIKIMSIDGLKRSSVSMILTLYIIISFSTVGVNPFHYKWSTHLPTAQKSHEIWDETTFCLFMLLQTTFSGSWKITRAVSARRKLLAGVVMRTLYTSGKSHRCKCDYITPTEGYNVLTLNIAILRATTLKIAGVDWCPRYRWHSWQWHNIWILFVIY